MDSPVWARLSDPNDVPELNPDEAMNRLDQGLETCRSVIADYRAALIANGTATNEIAEDRVMKSELDRN